MKLLKALMQIGLTVAVLSSYAQNSDQFSEIEIKEMLRVFYTASIKAEVEGFGSKDWEKREKRFYDNYLKNHAVRDSTDSSEMREARWVSMNAPIDSIQKKYVSSKLYNYLKNVNRDGLVLDTDPLLNSQMVDLPMLDEMSFTKVKNDIYTMRYKYGPSYNTVKLRITKENVQYKIDDVLVTFDNREYELTKDEWQKN